MLFVFLVIAGWLCLAASDRKLCVLAGAHGSTLAGHSLGAARGFASSHRIRVSSPIVGGLRIESRLLGLVSLPTHDSITHNHKNLNTMPLFAVCYFLNFVLLRACCIFVILFVS